MAKRLAIPKAVQEKASIEDVYEKLVEINRTLTELLVEMKEIKGRMPDPDGSSHR